MLRRALPSTPLRERWQLRYVCPIPEHSRRTVPELVEGWFLSLSKEQRIVPRP
ncbi:MAG: hypothetical protein GXO76_15975 [Calditrichaeota bacterium]|nr:hypothetical protein [Calditrichota bacterium]